MRLREIDARDSNRFPFFFFLMEHSGVLAIGEHPDTKRSTGACDGLMTRHSEIYPVRVRCGWEGSAGTQVGEGYIP